MTYRARRGRGRGYLYTPASRPMTHAWIISPGLHYEGPDDPRMDRLARILAGAGAAVLSPRIADLTELCIGPAVIDDLQAAFAAFLAEPEISAIDPGMCPGVFSVSVGSLAALRLATSPALGHRVSRVVSLGGYGDPIALLRSLTGAPGAEETPDPLNRPAALLLVLDHLRLPIADRARLRRAWQQYVAAVWPRPELKVPGSTAHHAIAREMARGLDRRDRELFLIGCGALPGAHEVCDPVVEAPGRPLAFLDPRPHLTGLRARTDLIHGRNDPVIPASQSRALAAAIPHARMYELRTLAHSGGVSKSELVRQLPHLGREVRSITDVIRAVSSATPTTPQPRS